MNPFAPLISAARGLTDAASGMQRACSLPPCRPDRCALASRDRVAAARTWRAGGLGPVLVAAGAVAYAGREEARSGSGPLPCVPGRARRPFGAGLVRGLRRRVLERSPALRAGSRLGWAHCCCAALGTLCMIVAPFCAARAPIMSNYIPVLDGPLFLAGLLDLRSRRRR